MNNKVLKGLKIAGNVVFYAIIIVLLLFSIANIKKKDKSSFANLFGRGFLTVETDSMVGPNKDSFGPGELVVVKKANSKNIAKLKVGDIITFYDATLARDDANGISKSSYLNTHRIVYINTQGDTPIFITQGDKAVENGINYVAPIYDENGVCTNPDELKTNAQNSQYWQEVNVSDIKGIYVSHSKGWGNFMTTVNKHFFACVVLPVIILFLIELVVVIMNIIGIKNEKNKFALEADAEAQKEELRKQILAEMNAQNKEEMKKQILEELKKEQENKENN